MSLTPSASKIEKGATFTVAVKVDTQGQTINVVEATLGFPADKLAIVKVTPSASFTIQSPGSPRITKSQVAFSSGIPSPGYSGQSGTVGTVTFRALAPGVVTLSVDSGQVLLNDGMATTVQVQKKNSSVTIVSAPTPTPTPESIIPVVQENDLIVEQPVPEIAVPAPVATEVVSEVKTGGDVVTTITIRVKDLVRIIYVLAILLGIFIIISLYLFVTNINLRHKNKEMREMSKL